MKYNSKRPHWVYRLYDEDGVLIYIGCTVNVAKRADEWFTAFPEWAHLVRRIEADRHDTRADALMAEGELIDELQPRFNYRSSGVALRKARA